MSDPVQDAVASLESLAALSELPDEVTLAAAIVSHEPATLSVTEDVGAYRRVSTLKVISDAVDGFRVVSENAQITAQAGGDSATAARIASRHAAKVSHSAWFRDAALQLLLTANEDLSDEVPFGDNLLSPDAGPLDKIHSLQDTLAALAANPESFTDDDHRVAAAALLNVPADFWTNEEGAGVPWAETYFTFTLLKKARSAYLGAHQPADVGINNLYARSLELCAEKLAAWQYEAYCPARSAVEDYLAPETWIGGPERESACDEYDVQLGQSVPDWYGKAILPPPLIEGSADSLAEILGGEAAQGATLEVWDTLVTEIESNPSEVARAVRAADKALQNPEVREALRDLSVTGIGAARYVLENPELYSALAQASESVAAAAAKGLADAPKARALLREILSGIMDEFLSFSADWVGSRDAQLETLASTLMTLGLKAGQDGAVKSELENLLLADLEIAANVLASEDFQDVVAAGAQTFFAGGLGGLTAALADPQKAEEFADAVTAAFDPVVDGLTAGLDQDGKDALAAMLARLMAASAAASFRAAEEPELAPLIELATNEVMPQIEAALAWQMMTPCEQRQAARERRKKERETALPVFSRSGDMHAKLTASADPTAYFSGTGTKTFTLDGRDYVVTYHNNAAKADFPFGAMQAELDVTPMSFSVTEARKGFTDFATHENYFTSNKLLLEAPLVDLNGKTGPAAAFAADRYGNPCSFVDPQGRPHYLVYQHANVVGKNWEYLLDLWVETDDFQPGRRGEMTLAWDLVPTSPGELKGWGKTMGVDTRGVAAYLDKKLTRSWVHPEKNTGSWQIIDADGDGTVDMISWGAAISGTDAVQKLAPGPFAKNVFDMMKILDQSRKSR